MEKIKALETKSCQFCNKFFSPGMYSRWHGDRCKSNPARDPSEPWVVAARESSKRSGKLNRGVKRGPEARKNLAEGARKGWKTRKGS
jgi:hypothetical protein